MALDPALRKELTTRIDREIARLRSEINESVHAGRTSSYATMTGEVYDGGDQAVADLLADVEIAEVKRDMQAIEALETARARILCGLGGTCIDCGADIPPARLRANPAALRCHNCQTQYENTYAHSAAAHL